MLLLFLTVIYSCIVYVGQKPTRACVVLLFKYADYKSNISYLILSFTGIFENLIPESDSGTGNDYFRFADSKKKNFLMPTDPRFF